MYQPINEENLADIILLAADTLKLSTVWGYYGQTWIHMKKDDLVDLSVSAVV